jgi:predicted 2-oxoglutarate/Fe(II)-dependent dioxygenase YbiX
MNSKLVENNYLIIPNFISSYRASVLAKEFQIYCEENNLIGDEQIPSSHSKYNYISFLELLCEKTPEVSEILEETVLPTYTYSRVYKNSSILKKHTDRDSCEISLTLHLGGDKPWLIWIKTPKGENRSVELNPGDAMMYLGKSAEHWREKYDGEEYTQVFLHYVRSRGECAYTYFDTEEHKGKNDDKIKSNKSSFIDEDVQLSKISDKNIKKNSKVVFNSNSKLEEFIKVFDNIISENDCNLILNEYKNSNEWRDTEVASGVDKSIRNCMKIPISESDIIQNNLQKRKDIDKLIFNSVNNIITSYRELFSTFNVEIDTGYELLKYQEGEFYLQHTDSFKEQQRSLSCSIQLNDDYDGGEFAFFDREILIRTKPGSVIVFPSNFMFPHEIMPVIKGTRYSIITWLV